GLHSKQVAVDHGLGLDHDLAKRHRGHFHGISSRFPDTAFHDLSGLAQMPVACVQVRPGVDDRNDRLAAEIGVRQAVLHRYRSMSERVGTLTKPALATEALKITLAH